MTTDWLDTLRWTDDGLMPVIAQEYQSGQILMMAWMNREALSLTAEKKQAVYWSRSRGKLWFKGEESGNWQKVHNIRTDCDSDVILIEVEQIGGVACHTGRHHCFFQQLNSDNQWETVEPVLKDPDSMYGGKK